MSNEPSMPPSINEGGIIAGDDGTIRFTSQNKRRLSRYFALAGIDINTIKTVEQYAAARNAAAPYFEQWIVSELQRKEPSLERQLLIAVFLGDKREARKLRLKLSTEAAEAGLGVHTDT